MSPRAQPTGAHTSTAEEWIQPAVVGRYRIDVETVESLSVSGGRLLAQRGSRTPLPLQEGLDGSLHFVPDELSYFMPVRDARNTVIRLDYYRDGEGPPIAYPRLPDAP